MRRGTIALVLVLTALLAAAVPASAGPPPRGYYECTISGLLFGDITIKKGNEYRRFGKTGKFTVDGRKIKFTSGPFKGIKGDWEMATSSTTKVPQLNLQNPLDDFESIYCVKH